MPVSEEFFKIQQELIDFRRAILAGEDPKPEELAQAIRKYRVARAELARKKTKVDTKDGE